jgi:hypothetical protein
VRLHTVLPFSGLWRCVSRASVAWTLRRFCPARVIASASGVTLSCGPPRPP